MRTYGRDKLTPEQLPQTKKEALQTGQIYYFTGIPCRHGHLSPRYSKNDQCVECRRISARKKYIPRSQTEQGIRRLKPYFYSDYIKDQDKQDVETVSITVPKGSDLHQALKGTRDALESLDMHELYGREKKTVFEIPQTKEIAEKTGEKSYFDWRICRNGHISPRNHRDECFQCTRDATLRATKKKNKKS